MHHLLTLLEHYDFEKIATLPSGKNQQIVVFQHRTGHKVLIEHYTEASPYQGFDLYLPGGRNSMGHEIDRLKTFFLQIGVIG